MRTDRTVRSPDSAEAAKVRGSGPEQVLPRRWLWWEDGAQDGVTNMATDSALLSTVRPDTGVWRWYGWSHPTVSFGRHERIVARFTPEWLSAAGLHAVRRPTGGRALLHARELTYCVTLPLPATLPWRAAYDAVNAVLLAALQDMGVPAVLSAGAGQVAPDGPVCFDQPAAGELTVHGRKLVGSAVWRQGNAYLQHGSILLHDDQGTLALPAGGSAPPPAAALATLFPGHPDDALRRDGHAATRAVLQRFADVDPFVHPTEWPAHFASQHRHVGDTAWLWRR
jgi:lipoyl(octanoyl) transferase